MPIINGPPPNPDELGMTKEEKALLGRPRAVIYYQPGHSDVAKEFAAMVRNAKTEDNHAPLTVLCDIGRWDGVDLEGAHTVFIMRGMRDAQLTRFYQRNLPGCDIFYLNVEGELLGDRPEEITPKSNPFATFAKQAEAARAQAPASTDQSSAGTPATGASADADSDALGARPVPIDEQGEGDSKPRSRRNRRNAVGDDAGVDQAED